MLKETKREVFEQLLDGYLNLLVSDKDVGDEHYRENIATLWKTVYEAAFQDELVVLPKIVGKYLSWKKHDNVTIYKALDDVIWYLRGTKWDEVEGWFNGTDNSFEIFTRAWIARAWIVEETGEAVKL